MSMSIVLIVVALGSHSALSKIITKDETNSAVPCHRAGGIVQMPPQENGRRRMHTHNEVQEIHLIDEE